MRHHRPTQRMLANSRPQPRRFAALSGKRANLRHLLAALGLALASPALAGDLIVQVTNVREVKGEIACALHRNGSAFPSGYKGVSIQWQRPNLSGVTCRFPNLAAGDYAVAILHDLNGNRAPDTNIVGMPVEDWGVSNNIRHSFRPPNFNEAKFEIAATGSRTILIQLAR